MTSFEVSDQTEVKHLLTVRMEDHTADELISQLAKLVELHGEQTDESESAIEQVFALLAELQAGLDRL